MYPPAKAGGFSLRGLGRENFRTHYIAPGADRPLPDVQRCVGVGVGLVPAADTLEGGLVWPVPFVDASTDCALARGVAGVHIADGNAGTLRFIGNKPAELSERPITKPRSRVRSSGRYPRADALQILQANAARSAFSVRYKRLRYAVVDVLLISPLFACELSQTPLCGFGAAFLETAPALLDALSPTFGRCARVSAAVTVSGQRGDAEVHAEPIFGLELIGLRDIAGGGEIPFAAHNAEINFAFAEGHQAPLMLAHYDGHDNAALQGPQAGGRAVLDESQDAIVIRLRGIWSENGGDGAIGLEGIRDFGDGAHRRLRGQTEAGPYLRVSHLVHVVLAPRVGCMAGRGKPCRRFVASRQSRPQASGLIGRGHKLHRGDELHTFKYRTLRPTMQETALARGPLFLRRLNSAVSHGERK